MGNLANAIIMGAQKCGTTNLFYCLKQHPEISRPINPDDDKPVKEIDFFFQESLWEKGVDWYKAHFNSQNTIYLDASPNYLSDSIVYRRIYETCPDAKLIVCLRNPIDRAYSQYNHYRQDMPLSTNYDWNHSLNFEENIRAELSRKSDFSNDFKYFLGRGVYIEQLESLLKYFDLSQLHITIMEDWKLNGVEELKKVLTFLDVDIRWLPVLPPLFIPRHNREYIVEPLSPESRRILLDFFAPYNERLFKFLKYETPEWLQ